MLHYGRFAGGTEGTGAGTEMIRSRSWFAVHTVRIPASLRITSWVRPIRKAPRSSRTPIMRGILSSHGMPALTSTAVGAAHADGDHSKASRVRVCRIGAPPSSLRGKRSFSEYHLVYYSRAGFQKPMPYLRDTERRSRRTLPRLSARARSRSVEAPCPATIRWSTVDS